jgi:hypothetical protein
MPQWQLTRAYPTSGSPVDSRMCPRNGPANALYYPQIAFAGEDAQRPRVQGAGAVARQRPRRSGYAYVIRCPPDGDRCAEAVQREHPRARPNGRAGVIRERGDSKRGMLVTENAVPFQMFPAQGTAGGFRLNSGRAGIRAAYAGESGTAWIAKRRSPPE